MKFKKSSFLLVLCLVVFSSLLSAQKNIKSDKGIYKKEMQSFHVAIEKNFYDKASGYYFVELNPAKREVKEGFKREYSWLWALCSMFEAVNEMEKVDNSANLIDPIFSNMKNYYDTNLPKPGYNEYVVKLKPGLRYYDDNQWIGIAALDIYKRTKKQTYLALGKQMYQFMMTAYDTKLGGGLYWRETDFETKNTCSNGPGVLVALKMYEQTKQKCYLDTALLIYTWTNEKLQAPSGLYYDNIKTKDGSLNKTIFSYNTGTMLQSNVYLYELTGDKKYLKRANDLADASLTYFYSNGKFRDGYWFNAVMLRAYQHLLKYNKDTKYILGFKKCLDYTLKNERNEQGLFVGKDGIHNLVEQGGMLEILARYAWMESHYNLSAK
jgi:rhamnogalacturonyl hydrolase YesR